MDSSTVQIFYVLSVLTISYCGLGTALRVEVFPAQISGFVGNEVNVYCYPNDSPSLEGNFVLVELGKRDEQPIAMLRNGEFNYGPGRKMNMKADGRIVNNSTQSFLRVILTDPGLEDAGVYVCSVFYDDGFGQLKEVKEEANVTVDNFSTRAFIDLLNKMADLDKQLAKQNNHTQYLEKELKEYQGKTNVLENKVAQQEEELRYMQLNESVTIAFSYGYTGKGKVVQGQPMLFKVKILDLGGAYNPQTGVFTAPREGLYVFHLVVAREHGFGELILDVKANGKKLASLYAKNHDTKDETTVSVFTTLKGGDRVMPMINYFNAQNKDGWWDKYTTFSGYLLKLL